MSGARLTLLSYKPSDISTGGVATYGVQHSTDGRGGTCLELEVDLRIVADISDPDQRVEASVRFSDCRAATPALALMRLAGWLERAAEALRVSVDPATLDGTVRVVTDAGALPIGTRRRFEPRRERPETAPPEPSGPLEPSAPRVARADGHGDHCPHPGLTCCCGVDR